MANTVYTGLMTGTFWDGRVTGLDLTGAEIVVVTADHDQVVPWRANSEHYEYRDFIRVTDNDAMTWNPYAAVAYLGPTITEFDSNPFAYEASCCGEFRCDRYQSPGVSITDLVAPNRVWTASQAYTLNQIVYAQGAAWKATTAGTAGITEPAAFATNRWVGPGGTVSDGSVVWTWIGSAELLQGVAEQLVTRNPDLGAVTYGTSNFFPKFPSFLIATAGEPYWRMYSNMLENRPLMSGNVEPTWVSHEVFLDEDIYWIPAQSNSWRERLWAWEPAQQIDGRTVTIWNNGTSVLYATDLNVVGRWDYSYLDPDQWVTFTWDPDAMWGPEVLCGETGYWVYVNDGYGAPVGLEAPGPDPTPATPVPSAIGTASLDYQLGCGEYRVLVQKRCASQFECELRGVSSISFNRVLNEISEATIEVGIDGCCECLADVNPWQHEIAIFRNEALVWVGPIVDMDISEANDKAVFYARDLLAWADRRVVELADEDYEPEYTDLSDAYLWLLNHAYCKDPWCMTWSIDPVGIPMERYYPSFDKAGGERWGGTYTNCGEEMKTLAEAGVDFTMINRHLWGGDTEVANPVSQNITLLDSHFQTKPDLKISGSKMVTRQVSAGGDGGYQGYFDDQISIYPEVLGPITPTLLTENQTKYGLLESLNTTAIYDEVDTTVIPNPVLQDAKSRWDLLHEPYVYINGGQLSADAPVSFDETLIPGGIVTIKLAGSCRQLSADKMRLRMVSVKVDSQGGEVVSVELTPLGTQETLVTPPTS